MQITKVKIKHKPPLILLLTRIRAGREEPMVSKTVSAKGDKGSRSANGEKGGKKVKEGPSPKKASLLSNRNDLAYLLAGHANMHKSVNNAAQMSMHIFHQIKNLRLNGNGQIVSSKKVKRAAKRADKPESVSEWSQQRTIVQNLKVRPQNPPLPREEDTRAGVNST